MNDHTGKEKPMKVEKVSLENLVNDGFVPLICGECPRCGWEDLTEIDNYCNECGQKLSWEEWK